jgi:hypothetical protein
LKHNADAAAAIPKSVSHRSTHNKEKERKKSSTTPNCVLIKKEEEIEESFVVFIFI